MAADVINCKYQEGHVAVTVVFAMALICRSKAVQQVIVLQGSSSSSRQSSKKGGL